jgi:hypothetical protein
VILAADTIVEQSSGWTALTAFFSLITPLVLLFSLWVQKQWADKAAHAASEVKSTLHDDRLKTGDQLAVIAQTTHETHVLVNSQRGVILKNMAILSRNHATMARKAANLSNDPDDRTVADAAEQAAISAENDLALHEKQQDIVDGVTRV